MIVLLLRDVPYEQDIRELFMAFYPGEEYCYEPVPEGGARAVLEGFRTEQGGRAGYGFRLMTQDGETWEYFCPEENSRFGTKSWIKQELYRRLSAHTGTALPWGTLTGIRPVRLAVRDLEAGMAEEAVAERFRREYLVGEEKLELCMDIARRERRLLEQAGDGGWSLYIGIPFCPTRCLYCSFTSYPAAQWKDRKRDYLESLEQEIAAAAQIMEGRRLQTVYMGGGPPTSLEAEELREILDCVRTVLDTDGLLELTVEAGRPDSITPEKLSAMRECGVTRISVNPQSMNQKTLDLIGRRHTVEQVRESFRMARSAGFDDINMDIIVGLPGETAEDLGNTLREIEALGPDSLTVHCLALKRASRLSAEKELYRTAPQGVICDMIEQSRAACARMGLSPYYLYRQKNIAGNLENVGYSRPGKEGLYNVLIMEERQPIVGCGAGSSSKIPVNGDVHRIENVKDPQLYIGRIGEMIARKQEIKHLLQE